MDNKDLIKAVSYQIFDRRMNHNMSLAALGAKIGAAPVVVWQWEQGRHMPSAKHLVGLADAFGCSVDDLLGRSK